MPKKFVEVQCGNVHWSLFAACSLKNSDFTCLSAKALIKLVAEGMKEVGLVAA